MQLFIYHTMRLCSVMECVCSLDERCDVLFFVKIYSDTTPQPGTIVFVFLDRSFFRDSASGETPLAGRVCDLAVDGDCCNPAIALLIFATQSFISSCGVKRCVKKVFTNTNSKH